MSRKTAPRPPTGPRPKLVVFSSSRSGSCRRLDGYLAGVLQRRANHDTFDCLRVDVDERPDLAARFRVDRVPVVLVLEDRTVKVRLTEPRTAVRLREALRPWLR
jgi:hypothetical protein